MSTLRLTLRLVTSFGLSVLLLALSAALPPPVATTADAELVLAELAPIQRFGGPTRGLAVSGRTAAVGVGRRVAFVDLGDGGLSLLGETPSLAGTVRTLVRHGNVVFAATDGGLNVIDASDAAHPTISASWVTPTPAVDVAIDDTGEVLWLTAGTSGIYVLDVEALRTPVLVTHIAALDHAWGVSLHGDRAAVAEGEAGLRLFEWRQGEVPVPTGRVRVQLEQTVDVVLAEDFAYIAVAEDGIRAVALDSEGGGAQLPIPTARRRTMVLEQVGDRLYGLPGTSWGYLDPYELDEGGIPVRGAKLHLPHGGTAVAAVAAVAAAKDGLLIAAEIEGLWHVRENPQDPASEPWSILDRLHQPTRPTDIDAWPDTWLLAEGDRGVAGIARGESLEGPTQRWRIPDAGSAHELVSSADGRHAYVAASGGLLALRRHENVDTPPEMFLDARLAGARHITWLDERLLLATESDWHVLDPAADPLRPSIEASMAKGRGDRLHGAGSRVIAWDSRSVRVFDLGQIGEPRSIGTWSPPGGIRVHVLGARMVDPSTFGALFESEMSDGSFRTDFHLLAIEPPETIRTLGVLDLPGRALAIDSRPPWVLTADQQALRAIDLSQPDWPDEGAVIPLHLDEIPLHLHADGGEVLVAGTEMLVLGSARPRVYLPRLEAPGDSPR